MEAKNSPKSNNFGMKTRMSFMQSGLTRGRSGSWLSGAEA